MPAGELRRRENLFRVLSIVLPVRFVPASANSSQRADGFLVFGEQGGSFNSGKPSLVFSEAQPADEGEEKQETVTLGLAGCLDTSLRGRTITETKSPSFSPLPVRHSDVALATVRNLPVWVQRPCDGGPQYFAAVAPGELPPQKSLRSFLRDGQFIRHLPLIHFLKELTRDIEFIEPPLRANFIVDDPNIRFQRYGFINYKQLIGEATRHDYTVTLATIPLDLNWMHPEAVRVSEDSQRRISLAIHGNDHTHQEFVQDRSDNGHLMVAAQAIRRVERFEERHGVPIGRVMVPPHSLCSQGMLQALFRVGVNAVCSSRLNCWTSHEKAGDFSALDDPGPIEWFPADFVEGGMAVIPRKPELFDIVFRAYLRKPLIEYYHHNDFERGLEVLAETAATIRSLGDVQWMTLDEIAISNFAQKQVGSTLFVRMYSGCVEVNVPEGVRDLHIQLPTVQGGLNIDSAATNDVSLPLSVQGHRFAFSPYQCKEGETVRIKLKPKNAVHHSEVPGLRPAIRPILRRVIREVQDQVRPFLPFLAVAYQLIVYDAIPPAAYCFALPLA